MNIEDIGTLRVGLVGVVLHAILTNPKAHGFFPGVSVEKYMETAIDYAEKMTPVAVEYVDKCEKEAGLQ